jgi:EKC/KEOPS complex subunit PCC1/LAGE3
LQTVPLTFTQENTTDSSSTINIPFPTAHLATSALRTLQVDKELSAFVHRTFSIDSEAPTILRVEYAAATNRMLRVSVNGFFESLGVVVHCMEELDVDVIAKPTKQPLTGVQGLDELPAQT